jgi:hypothetical protein
MTDSWTWRYVDAEGRACTPAQAPSTPFPSQSDAESWLGEEWRTLLEAGVDAVHLLHEDAEVYGPMSLRPAE